jgi:hypothetical protein
MVAPAAVWLASRGRVSQQRVCGLSDGAQNRRPRDDFARENRPGAEHGRQEFGKRFRQRFLAPAYGAERDALTRLEQIAWEAFDGGRKAPITVNVGAGFADRATTAPARARCPRPGA